MNHYTALPGSQTISGAVAAANRRAGTGARLVTIIQNEHGEYVAIVEENL